MQEVLQSTLHLFGSQRTLTPNSLLTLIGTVLCSPSEERKLALYLLLPPGLPRLIIIGSQLQQQLESRSRNLSASRRASWKMTSTYQLKKPQYSQLNICLIFQTSTMITEPVIHLETSCFQMRMQKDKANSTQGRGLVCTEKTPPPPPKKKDFHKRILL